MIAFLILPFAFVFVILTIKLCLKCVKNYNQNDEKQIKCVNMILEKYFSMLLPFIGPLMSAYFHVEGKVFEAEEIGLIFNFLFFIFEDTPQLVIMTFNNMHLIDTPWNIW